jgi:hypothetical protein
METKLIKVNDDYSIKQNGEYVAFANEDFTGYAPQEFRDNLIGVLSKQNCDGIFGVIDVDKLANEWVFETNGHKWSNNDDTAGDNYGSYKEGFNKAMELNKDKVFTLEDIKRAISFGEDNTDMDSFNTVISDKEVNEFIQSLQQPTEIEVEIVMETKQQLVNGYKNQPENVIGFVAEYENILAPKLDSEGCLILKKI